MPGDIEENRERDLLRYWGHELDSDWLHAAHHGSLTSSSQAWLKHVSPGTVVISSGRANRFGHPHPAVVARISTSGSETLLTAMEGALEFEFRPGRPPLLEAHRRSNRRYWME